MKALNLDPTFRPYPHLPEVEFQSFSFSGGEPHIKIVPDSVGDKIIITHRICSFNDFGLLLISVDALRRLDVQHIEVFIPYFPAARQDRVMVEGESLSVKVYADILNTLGLAKVHVYDPHSEVTSAVLNNSKSINNHSLVSKVVDHIGKDMYIVSPDGGALKKIHKVAAHLQDYEVVECGKSRDVKTGKLSGFTVPLDDLNGKACLIIDDICDGGGTFMGLAEELKAKNSGPLYLVVSHGIFSKGLDKLKGYFEIIFTTDSFKEIEDDKVVQIKMSEIL